MLQSRTVREGTVGLFALLGLVLVGAVAVWLRGGGFGNPTYNLLVDFDNASGLQVGAPVMFRGVSVGKIAGLRPSSNGIEAVLQIASTKLKIPRDSTIQISRFGLIGEASIDIMPKRQLTDQDLALDPTQKDCQDNKKIFCDGDRFRGETGSQLVSSLTQLSKTYSDPQFVANLNATARNAAIAANRIAKMSDEIALLSKTARYQIRGVGRTTNAIANTAQSADLLTQNLNRIVVMNQASISQTISNSAQLMRNLNQLVLDNRVQVTSTLRSIQNTSQDVQHLSRRLEGSVQLLDTSLISVNQGVQGVNQGINALDMPKLASDLQIVLNNAAETSKNLREISQNFNDPTIFLNIQKTLDSARATFENVQKITADVDKITGDPAFVNNLKKLVDGLGSLVSSTEQLQQQLYADRLLTNTSQQLKYQIDVQQKLVLMQNKLPLAVTAQNAPVANQAIAPVPLTTKANQPLFQQRSQQLTPGLHHLEPLSTTLEARRN